jgi:Zn-dependent M16 (insulinase) family peptidase
MELKKVKEGFEWMQMLLWNTKWQPDRLKIIAQRLANEVHTLMDHGSTMAHAMTAESLYHMDSKNKNLKK